MTQEPKPYASYKEALQRETELTPEPITIDSPKEENPTEQIKENMRDTLTKFHEAEGVIPYRDFVKTTFAYNTSINMGSISVTLNLLHVTLGIAGEYIEFKNEINHHIYLKELFEGEEDISPTSQQELTASYTAAEKELGDLCYYIQMTANLINISLPHVNHIFNDKNERAIENFVDAVKKKIFYGHEVDLWMPVVEVWSQLNYIAHTVFNKPIEYFILQNKTKLMKRYPLGKFRSEDAATKKDEPS